MRTANLQSMPAPLDHLNHPVELGGSGSQTTYPDRVELNNQIASLYWPFRTSVGNPVMREPASYDDKLSWREFAYVVSHQLGAVGSRNEVNLDFAVAIPHRVTPRIVVVTDHEAVGLGHHNAFNCWGYATHRVP